MSVAELRVEDSPWPEDQRFMRCPGVLHRTIPEIAVLLLVHPDQDVLVLAGTGLALWQELDVPCALGEVALRLSARYGAEPDVVISSLGGVLAELETRGVVQRHDG